MRVLNNIISFVFLFCSISSLPAGEDNNSRTHKSSKYKIGHKESKNQTEILVSNPEEYGGRDVLPRDTASRSGLRDKCLLWNNAEIPYFIESIYGTREYDMIIQAIHTLQFWTCIKFVPYNPNKYNQPDYVRIGNFLGKGCGSYTGRIGGVQELNLDPLDCFENIGTILHELLHTIGVKDQHNRPDRDKYVTINLDAIIPDLRDNFDKDDEPMVNYYQVPYDYSSVMHDDEYAGSKNGTKTIVPKMAINMPISQMIDTPIGQRRGISVRDAMLVMRMYSCSYNQFNVTEEEPFSRVMPNYGESIFSKEMLYHIYYKNLTYIEKIMNKPNH